MTSFPPLALLVAIAIPACADNTTPPPPEPEGATARIRGPLAPPTIDEAKSYHDRVAMAGEPQTAAAGDFAHHVLLGTADFGTPEHEFLAIDQWTNVEGAQATYSDPQFQAALAPLFSAPPSVELFARQSDWVSWGDMSAGITSGQPYWYVIVKGRLRHESVEDNQDAHDTAAAAGEDAALAAGDVAHLPHLSLTDDRVFFNIDIWSSHDGMVATFSNADFQAQLTSLFESPPEVRVYQSSDWYQWFRP